MAIQQTLAQVDTAATTLTDIFRAGNPVTLSGLAVCNRGVDGTFRLALSLGGAAISDSHYVFYDYAVLAKVTYITTLGIPMIKGDVIRVYTSHGDFSVQLYGGVSLQASQQGSSGPTIATIG